MTDTRRDLRAPIALKIRYKSASVDEFAEQYAADISRGGVFIKSKSPLDVGTLLKFELQLKDETELVAGVGRVVWIRKLEDAYEDHPAGMGIKFVKMDGQSRTFVEELVSKRGDGTGRFDAGSADVTPEHGIRIPAGEPEAVAPEDRSDLRNTSELLASAIAEAGVGGETASEALAQGEKAYRKTQEVTGQIRTEGAAEAVAAPAAAEPEKKGSPMLWVAAALVLALSGGAYLLFGRAEPTSETVDAVAAKPAPVEAAPAVHAPAPEAAEEEAPADEPAPELVAPPAPYRLVIVTEPAGATVKVGDQEVVSPGELTYDEKPKSMDVAISLEGHRPHYQRLRASAYKETGPGTFEAFLDITLRPRGGAAAKPPATSEGEAAPAEEPKLAAPEPKLEPKAEPKLEPKSEPKTEPKAEPKPEAEAKVDPEP